MVRRVIDDPETAEGLSPRDFPLGCKRPDPRTSTTTRRSTGPRAPGRPPASGAIEEITPTGIRTEQGDFELDVIVYATGFDAMTGALDRIDIRGRDGQSLRDAWADGARTLLGIQIAGFPNFFTITGPGSPSVLANMVVCAEQHVEWIGACLEHMRDHGLHQDRADPRGPGRVGRHRQPDRGGHDVHRADVQFLVPRRQHPGQGARLPAVRRWPRHATSSTASGSSSPATKGSCSHEQSAREHQGTDRRLRPLLAGHARAESDDSWRAVRAAVPGRLDRARRRLLGGQRLRRGRRRVPRLGALLVRPHGSRGQLDRARRQPAPAAHTGGDRSAGLVPGAPDPLRAAGAPGGRTAAPARGTGRRTSSTSSSRPARSSSPTSSRCPSPAR